jgi:hypothetical protein
MTTYTKATPGVLDYGIDYSAWLGVDTIATSAWEVPTGIIADSDSNDTTTTTITLSGGTAKRSYEIINTITTAAGWTDRRCITIAVSECR